VRQNACSPASIVLAAAVLACTAAAAAYDDARDREPRKMRNNRMASFVPGGAPQLKDAALIF
jgi:hypothetical protein